MCFLYSIFSKKNKEKGFSLIEVLAAVGVATVATLITSNIFQMNIRNFNISNTVLVMLDEQQLYLMLTKTIGDQGKSCEKNLKASSISKPASRPSNGYIGMYGQHFAKGVGILEEVHLFDQTTGNQKSTTPVFKVGPFMQHLNIVKMDFASPEPIDPSDPNFPTALNTEVRRDFTVYYKFVKGSKKTRSGGICTITDTSGCEKVKCTFDDYELAGVDVATGKCQATCVKPDSLTGGGGSVACHIAKETGETFVGCGTTKDNKDPKTTAFGYNAGNSRSTGEQNIFIGNNVGNVNTTGGKNVFIGRNAGTSNTTGDQNTFIGRSAGMYNTTGDQNTFIGQTAGLSNTTSTKNIFIGAEAGYGNTTGAKNVFIGVEAGKSDPDVTPAKNVTGDENVAMGYQAGNKLTSGTKNVFIGVEAGKKTTTGLENVFIGYRAGLKNTEHTSPEHDYQKKASRNTYIGMNAGRNNTSSRNSIFIGYKAGEGSSGGQGNTFIGSDSGRSNRGEDNVFVGIQSGLKNVGANSNTFVGAYAGSSNTTGGDNVFIGKNSGSNNNTGGSNVFIGNGAGEHNKGGINKTGSRQLNIGNLIFGRMPSSAPTTKFINSTDSTRYLNSTDEGIIINGDLYVKGKIFKKCGEGPCKEALTSSKVYKKNITPFVDFNKALTDITTTPLFTYEYKKDHPEHQRMGIIAEDLPPHLQIKDQYEPVKPDWVSIYGTFWASIKALFNKVTNLTKSILKLNSITSSLKVNLYEVKEKLEDLHGVKDRLEVLEKETQFLRNQNKELRKDNKELKRQIKTLNKKMKVSQ